MHIKTLAGVLAGLSLFAAACGDDTESSSATTEPTVTTTPATSAAASGGDETAVASRIISLSPTATEMVFAIGAGDQVIGVDDFSNYPPEAESKMQGFNGFVPYVAAIAMLSTARRCGLRGHFIRI